MTLTSSPQLLDTFQHTIPLDPSRLDPYNIRTRDPGTPTLFPSGARSTPDQRRGTRVRTYWRESLLLMEKHVAFGRRRVRADDQIYQCGDTFDTLYLINSGLFKIVSLAQDGREQPAGLYFKGDWLGFDGIPAGQYGCSAVALDTGELWTIRYDALLQASATEPTLMRLLLAAISAQLARNRDASLSMGTLSADARVADFLLQWAHSLAERGMRTDEINVHMSRADIGNYLGLRLESVSRALSRLARCGVICFHEKGRRDISIPNVAALSDFIQKSIDTANCELH